MRLKSDEQEVLRCRDGNLLIDHSRISATRTQTILKTFRYLGYVDADDLLTPRGRHVASKLPRLPVPDVVSEPVEELDPIEFTDDEEWN